MTITNGRNERKQLINYDLGFEVKRGIGWKPTGTPIRAYNIEDAIQKAEIEIRRITRTLGKDKVRNPILTNQADELKRRQDLRQGEKYSPINLLSQD